jgi:hypothetical protein
MQQQSFQPERQGGGPALPPMSVGSQQQYVGEHADGVAGRRIVATQPTQQFYYRGSTRYSNSTQGNWWEQQGNNIGVNGYNGLPWANYSFVQPSPLGGYVFGSYCNSPFAHDTVPSAYSLYTGVPGYIYVDEGAVVDILPVTQEYSGDYVPYTQSASQTNVYNSYSVTNNYYSNGGAAASAPSQAQSAVPPSDYNAALADIQQAWQNGSANLFRRHLPDSGTKIAVSIDGKYSYSIDADHFSQITQDAFDALRTYSFEITYVQKHVDGTITGFATHSYSPASVTDGTRSTMYLSFTLSNATGSWVITAIDSSKTPIMSSLNGQPNASAAKPPVTNQAEESATSTG